LSNTFIALLPVYLTYSTLLVPDIIPSHYVTELLKMVTLFTLGLLFPAVHTGTLSSTFLVKKIKNIPKMEAYQI